MPLLVQPNGAVTVQPNWAEILKSPPGDSTHQGLGLSFIDGDAVQLPTDKKKLKRVYFDQNQAIRPYSNIGLIRSSMHLTPPRFLK